MKRAIQREILDPLSLEILEGRFGEGSNIVADVRDDGLVFNLPATGRSRRRGLQRTRRGVTPGRGSGKDR